jgi:hypothetical protein
MPSELGQQTVALMRNDEMMLGADRALDDFRPLRDATRNLADTLADPGL